MGINAGCLVRKWKFVYFNSICWGFEKLYIQIDDGNECLQDARALTFVVFYDIVLAVIRTEFLSDIYFKVYGRSLIKRSKYKYDIILVDDRMGCEEF